MIAFIIIRITITDNILKLRFLLSVHHAPWAQTHLGHIVRTHHESDKGASYIPLPPVNHTRQMLILSVFQFGKKFCVWFNNIEISIFLHHEGPIKNSKRKIFLFFCGELEIALESEEMSKNPSDLDCWGLWRMICTKSRNTLYSYKHV